MQIVESAITAAATAWGIDPSDVGKAHTKDASSARWMAGSLLHQHGEMGWERIAEALGCCASNLAGNQSVLHRRARIFPEVAEKINLAESLFADMIQPASAEPETAHPAILVGSEVVRAAEGAAALPEPSSTKIDAGVSQRRMSLVDIARKAYEERLAACTETIAGLMAVHGRVVVTEAAARLKLGSPEPRK